MMAWCEVILWPLVAVYAVTRVCHTLTQFVPKVPVAQPVEAYDDTVPEDLVALALQYPESWAQEDMMKVIREKYDTLRDWNLVRSAFGVGRIDA
jgi:hypothetical protein